MMDESKYEELVKKIEQKERRPWLRYLLLLIPAAIVMIVSFSLIQIKSDAIDNELDSTRRSAFTKDSLLITAINRSDDITAITNEILRDVESGSGIDTLQVRAYRQLLEELKGVQEQVYSLTNYQIVRYYARKADDPKIDTILANIGFDINRKIVPKDNGTKSVNAIWYGDSVDTQIVSILAETLIGSNIDIKWIFKFTDSEGYTWKNKSIELGYSQAVETSQRLDTATIQYLLKQ